MKKTSILIILVLLFLILGSTIVNADETVYEINNQEDFVNALTTIHDTTNGEYVLDLKADITLDDSSLVKNKINVDNGNTVTIKGNNHTIHFLIGDKDKFNVSNNAVLNLGTADGNDSLTLEGAGNDLPSYDAFVWVGNATVNMYDGVTLTKNYSGSSALVTGGVRIGTNGTFNMYGGAITDNRVETSEVGGTAVNMESPNGTFNMYDGELSNNYSVLWAGAIMLYDESSVINITGGSISNNTSQYGGAIVTAGGNVTIKNAKIENNVGNYGGAILHYSGNLTIENSTLKGNQGVTGGVIANRANLIFKNNIAENNTGKYGGVVRNLAGSMTSENNVIKNNTAQATGGAIYTSVPITSSGDIITENTADYAGGVAITGGTANFSTTKVYNNKATSGANDYYISDNATSVNIIDAATMNEFAIYGDDVVSINGWYTDEDDNRFAANNVTDLVSTITAGTEYYLTAAGSQVFVVEFETNGGSNIDNQMVTPGNKVEKPENPTKDGYTFENWYVDENCSTVFDFDTAITSNKTIYAKWTEVVIDVPEYEFVKGANQTYKIGEDENAEFKVNAEYSVFENGGKVYIDGELVDSKNYTAKSEKTNIVFNKGYMDTLKVGEHTLKVVFNDGGEATTKFKVEKIEETEEKGAGEQTSEDSKEKTTEVTATGEAENSDETIESTEKSNVKNAKTSDEGISKWTTLIGVSIIGIYMSRKIRVGKKQKRKLHSMKF